LNSLLTAVLAKPVFFWNIVLTKFAAGQNVTTTPPPTLFLKSEFSTVTDISCTTTNSDFQSKKNRMIGQNDEKIVK
jgi:hypothetical protein